MIETLLVGLGVLALCVLGGILFLLSLSQAAGRAPVEVRRPIAEGGSSDLCSCAKGAIRVETHEEWCPAYQEETA